MMLNHGIVIYCIITSSVCLPLVRSISFSVALTTIPPRFASVHHTISSWLAQEVKPQNVLLFIPQYYKRFKRKISSDADPNMAPSHKKARLQRTQHSNHHRALSHQLRKYPLINAAIDESVVQILSLNKDWGPITKVAGTLFLSELISARQGVTKVQNVSTEGDIVTNLDMFAPNVFGQRGTAMEWRNSVSETIRDAAHDINAPDYWIMCDDDVVYSPKLIYTYHSALAPPTEISQEHAMYRDGEMKQFQIGLTLFTRTYRLRFQLDSDNSITNVLHIQGVDTYVFPYRFIKPQVALNTNSSISYNTFIFIVQYLHTVCPDSYYQDDYVVSFAFTLAGLRLYSIRKEPWEYDVMGNNNSSDDTTSSLVQSIDGVSKAHSQMHMHELVFLREEVTKTCITNHANYINKLLLQM